MEGATLNTGFPCILVAFCVNMLFIRKIVIDGWVTHKNGKNHDVRCHELEKIPSWFIHAFVTDK